MGLSDELVRELQEIMKEEFKLELDVKDASELAHTLVDCYSLLLDEDKEGSEK